MGLTISEVAEKTGIAPHTLRFYEKEGLVPTVNRDHNGIRIYEEYHLEWLSFMVCLRSTNMPLSEMKKYVELTQYGKESISERKEMMLKHKKKVEEQLQETYSYLEKINYKLAFYDIHEKDLKILPQ
ncbi:MerR family transcriptional regulator [Niallia circulans]|uniref:MerR family transcriptional regulator n=1 Tax=Niallia circulans TaxID=1397 RepID=A0A553STD1_NIACI|nr:MerR family transcriptional regulator [Niallia circulans]TRZ40228.1 MerR family transcriptional regulator [Niallia circulans]